MKVKLEIVGDAGEQQEHEIPRDADELSVIGWRCGWRWMRLECS